jgi:hypothetical protein
MRTTVTLDADVERLLKNEAHEQRKSFKVVLNDAVRQALHFQPDKRSRKRFLVKARPMGLRPGIDPARLSEWADDLEADAFLATAKRLRERKR